MKDGSVADEKDQATAGVPDDPTEDLDLEAMGLEDVELTEEEEVALVAAQARPVRKSATEAEGKGRATPKQRKSGKSDSDEPRRATPAEFVSQSIDELKKVTWPSMSQWQQYFWVVLVFVTIMIFIILGMDLLFGTAILKFFG